MHYILPIIKLFRNGKRFMINLTYFIHSYIPATEEMTRQNDIVDEIQLPCSKILVRFGSRIYNVQKVMDSLLIKFQPGSPSHFYVIATLSDLATCNPTHIVPYLKAILGTMLANIKTTKKDNLR